MTELEMLSTKYGRIKYVAGQRIGNAVFVGEIYSQNDRKAIFVCECGNLFNAWIHSVKSNVTKSCGCYRKKYMTDKKTTHGMSRSPFYNLYNNIIERCYNPNNKSYKTYGGKGVTVCKEWRDSFFVFCDWCKENGWEAGLQIDKDINGDGMEYSPSKCKFVTPSVNSNNRSTSVFLNVNNVSKTIADWGKETGIRSATIWARKKMGWTDSEAVLNPLRKKKNI